MIGFCKQCGKKTKLYKHLCRKHYDQFNKFGKCLDNNPHSKKDKNEYKIKGDYTEVYTYDIKGNIDFVFKIDTEDLPHILKYTWGHSKVKTTSDGIIIYMTNSKLGTFHRYIMGNPRGTVDHINRDTTDNRKSNLRCATYTQQNLNRIYTSKRFDIKGIDIHKDIKRKKRYMSRFQLNGKCYRSPWYETYEEAVYSRYLLQQLSDIEVQNGNMSEYISRLTEEQSKPILKWFINRFKNRV